LIRDFLAAIAFLTRLPIGRRFVFGPKEVARSARWFPLVGAILGAISLAQVRLFAPIFPALVTAILLLGSNALLTGAMHLDGLADTADGFGGGRTREDVLRIMRDHAIGAYGAIALILTVALKIATIGALIEQRRATSALLLAPLLGRWPAVLLSATQPYARTIADDSRTTAGAPTRFVGRTELAIATVTAIAAAAGMEHWHGVEAVVLVGASAGAWAWCCRRRIGGITGDTLGAAIEIAECLVLLLFTALR
jgi:adenosylcobinamide-GDP ribazoletransferase